MNILYAVTEAAPFVKTGGLADVAGSLPVALAAAGANIRVILPLYEGVGEEWRKQMTFIKHFYVILGWRNLYCGLFQLEKDGVTYYFLDNEYYYKRTDLYGHFDDGERFGFFSHAVVQAISRMDWIPDIVHCNDWHTALIPYYLKEDGKTDPALAGIKTVFTIHNIAYQGRYSAHLLGELFGLPTDYLTPELLEYYGDISLLKGGICAADYITTVSPTYAQELQRSFYAQGLERVIAARAYKMRGILNGIDTQLWNPSTDPAIWQNYSADQPEGKAVNKRELQKVLGLNENPKVPLIACISRLVSHKGFDLIAARMSAIMEKDVQFVVLGTGDWKYEQLFKLSQAQYPGRLSANIMYSENLANSIYAGADLFLMPSLSEPCGLSQMIAMRYGTVPVVRETGGLFDSVSHWNPIDGTGRGFSFSNYDADEMMAALKWALDTYRDKDSWSRLVRLGMTADFSWAKSAREYLEIYSGIL